MSLRPMREYHIVVLGAGGVGKSCITAQFVQNVWIESYDPTIEDSYRKHLTVDGRSVVLEMYSFLDTAGTEQFTAMRELYMKQGQGFLLVFSICNMNSFRELADLREQIIRVKDDEDIPLVIAGNKSDMEEDRVVSRNAAIQLAAQLGQKPYYETSARRRLNIDDVFVDLCRQMIQKDLKRYEHVSQQLADGNDRSFHYSFGGSEGRNRGRRKTRAKKCVIL